MRSWAVHRGCRHVKTRSIPVDPIHGVVRDGVADGRRAVQIARPPSIHEAGLGRGLVACADKEFRPMQALLDRRPAPAQHHNALTTYLLRKIFMYNRDSESIRIEIPYDSEF
jgi:hypothetical protein